MKIDSTNIIHTKIIEEMKSGEFSMKKKLPKEVDLAKQYGVSRNHLREVLSELEREGFVSRIHGVGTIINHHVLQVKNRMDIETEFFDIIRQNGHEPGVYGLQVQVEKASPYVADKLNIPDNAEVLRISRVCTADGNPAIYCEDFLDKRLIKKTYSIKNFDSPIFKFLKECCEVEADMDLTRLHAITADKRLADILKIPVSSPLLNMEETDYDVEGNIVFYSRQYFVDEYIEHTVLRKKL